MWKGFQGENLIVFLPKQCLVFANAIETTMGHDETILKQSETI